MTELDAMLTEALDRMLDWSPGGSEREAWWLRLRIAVQRGEWNPASTEWERTDAYEGDEDMEPWFSLVDPWTGNGEDLITVTHHERGWVWSTVGGKGVKPDADTAKRAGVAALLDALSRPYPEDD